MFRSMARAALAIACLLGLATTFAWADGVDTTLYWTEFNAHNVNSSSFHYDGVSTVTYGATNHIVTTPGADGIIFAPDGDLLIGGQGNAVYKVNIAAQTFTGVNAGGASAFHLSLDPSGNTVWAGGIPGPLASVPLNPFSNGTFHGVSGSVSGVDSLAFVPGGSTYYTSSSPGGNGTVGTINMTTFVTTNLLSQAASHGMVYDPFTHCLMICGANSVCQFDPSTNTVVGTRNFALGGEFDQMSVDGHGHAWICNNDGHMLFIDYDASGHIYDAGNFTDYHFMGVGDLDDIAPLVGLGAPTPAPAGVVLLGLGGLGVAGWNLLRRRTARAKVAA
jgi:hypothetical protein